MSNKPNLNDDAPRWSLLSLFGAGHKTQSATAAPVAEPEPEPVIPANARRILVVDDDEVVCKATAMKLKKHGYAVSVATDGPSALHAARSEHPDLILLDLSFPPDVAVAWDGFGIMSWLRRMECTKKIPIVIITGAQGNSIYEKARGAGAAGFFHKPLDFTPLLSLIDLRLKQGASSQLPPAGTVAKD